MVLVLFIASIVFAAMVPGLMKRAHVRQQNRLLERCRALYVLAVKALELGEQSTARAQLTRIRRIESRWHYGNSIAFRFAIALWAIGAGTMGYILLRALSLLVDDVRIATPEDFLRRFAEGLPLFLVIGLVGPLHGLYSYFSAWTDWRMVNDCGDRLERILNAGRRVAIVSLEDDPLLFADGLTPEQLFGLGLSFTRRQLDKARRRLVAKLHPDRWHNAAPSVRSMHEETLKRVNAAYDRLRPLATS